MMVGMKRQPTPAAAKAKKSRPAALNPRQLRFVDEYLVDLNGTRAAIRAGYSTRGADVAGVRLLANARVTALLTERMRARSEKTAIDAEWVLRRLAIEADADIADIYDEQGNLKHPSAWPEVWRRGLVVGVETFQVPTGKDEDGKPVYAPVRKVRLTDRIKQVELIGKHIGVNAFREQLGISNPAGGPVDVNMTVELPAITQALKRVSDRK